MGIRFYCGNGHKIHVKAFLAGKRGICPKCGIKVDIPGNPQGVKPLGIPPLGAQPHSPAQITDPQTADAQLGQPTANSSVEVRRKKIPDNWHPVGMCEELTDSNTDQLMTGYSKAGFPKDGSRPSALSGEMAGISGGPQRSY